MIDYKGDYTEGSLQCIGHTLAKCIKKKRKRKNCLKTPSKAFGCFQQQRQYAAVELQVLGTRKELLRRAPTKFLLLSCALLSCRM